MPFTDEELKDMMSPVASYKAPESYDYGALSFLNQNVLAPAQNIGHYTWAKGQHLLGENNLVVNPMNLTPFGAPLNLASQAYEYVTGNPIWNRTPDVELAPGGGVTDFRLKREANLGIPMNSQLYDQTFDAGRPEDMTAKLINAMTGGGREEFMAAPEYDPNSTWDQAKYYATRYPYKIAETLAGMEMNPLSIGLDILAPLAGVAKGRMLLNQTKILDGLKGSELTGAMKQMGISDDLLKQVPIFQAYGNERGAIREFIREKTAKEPSMFSNLFGASPREYFDKPAGWNTISQNAPDWTQVYGRGSNELLGSDKLFREVGVGATDIPEITQEAVGDFATRFPDKSFTSLETTTGEVAARPSVFKEPTVSTEMPSLSGTARKATTVAEEESAGIFPGEGLPKPQMSEEEIAARQAAERSRQDEEARQAMFKDTAEKPEYSTKDQGVFKPDTMPVDHRIRNSPHFAKIESVQIPDEGPTVWTMKTHDGQTVRIIQGVDIKAPEGTYRPGAAYLSSEDGLATIELNKVVEATTLDHEMVHIVKKMGKFTDPEWTTLMKRFGNSEDLAEHLAKHQTQYRGLIKRIKDYLIGLFDDSQKVINDSNKIMDEWRSGAISRRQRRFGTDFATEVTKPTEVRFNPRGNRIPALSGNALRVENERQYQLAKMVEEAAEEGAPRNVLSSLSQQAERARQMASAETDLFPVVDVTPEVAALDAKEQKFRAIMERWRETHPTEKNPLVDFPIPDAGDMDLPPVQRGVAPEAFHLFRPDVVKPPPDVSGLVRKNSEGFVGDAYKMEGLNLKQMAMESTKSKAARQAKLKEDSLFNKNMDFEPEYSTKRLADNLLDAARGHTKGSSVSGIGERLGDALGEATGKGLSSFLKNKVWKPFLEYTTLSHGAFAEKGAEFLNRAAQLGVIEPAKMAQTFIMKSWKNAIEMLPGKTAAGARILQDKADLMDSAGNLILAKKDYVGDLSNTIRDTAKSFGEDVGVVRGDANVFMNANRAVGEYRALEKSIMNPEVDVADIVGKLGKYGVKGEDVRAARAGNTDAYNKVIAAREEWAKNFTGVAKAAEENGMAGQAAIGDLKTYEQILKDIDAKGQTKGMQVIQDKVTVLNKAGLKVLHDAGIISDTDYAIYEARGDWYTPFTRVMEDKQAWGKIHEFFGSERALEDPVTASMSNFQGIIARAEKNKANQVLFRDSVDLAKKNPELASWFEGLVKEVGATDFGEGAEDVVKVFSNGHARYFKITDKDLARQWRLLSPHVPTTGLQKFMRLPAQMIRRFVTISPRFIGFNFMRDSVARWFLSPFSKTPFDALWIKPTEEELLAFERSGARQGFHGNFENTWRQQQVKLSGDIANEKGTVLTTFDQMVDWAERGADYVESISTNVENKNRIAEFIQARNAIKAKSEQLGLGLTQEAIDMLAGNSARNLLDFAQAGSIARQISAYIPFFNASIQGSRRTWRAFAEAMGSADRNLFIGAMSDIDKYPEGSREYLKAIRTLEDTTRLSGKQMAVKTGIMATAAAIPLMWAEQNGRLEAYRQLPAYRRDYFWNFATPWGGWITIPKPFEIGVLSTTFDRGLSVAMGEKFGDAFKGFGASALRSGVPVDSSLLFGPMRPFIEAATNKDTFRDSYIVPPWEEKLAMPLREGAKKSSFLSRGVADAYNALFGYNGTFGKGSDLDPRSIEHIGSGLFGDFGRMPTALTSDYSMSTGLKLSGLWRKDTTGSIRDVGIVKDLEGNLQLGGTKKAQTFSKIMAGLKEAQTRSMAEGMAYEDRVLIPAAKRYRQELEAITPERRLREIAANRRKK